MRQLIIDIETSGTPFEDLDTETQQYLLKRADTPEKAQKVKDELNLWPLTGEIVCIGLLDVATQRGSSFFQAPGRTIASFEEDGMRFDVGTEAEVLERFWHEVADADRVITFNGRAFDMPWIFVRSLVHGIAATKNLMPPRYSTSHHCDLADQLAFYGATRHFALAFWCKTLGIASPKGDLSGAEVPQAFRNGEYERIARYNAADLRATRSLYLKWYETIGQV